MSENETRRGLGLVRVLDSSLSDPTRMDRTRFVIINNSKKPTSADCRATHHLGRQSVSQFMDARGKYAEGNVQCDRANSRQNYSGETFNDVIINKNLT